MLRKAGLIFAVGMGALMIIGAADVIARSRISSKIRSVELPGLNEDEILDLELGGNGTGRFTYNTRNGRLIVRARGKVTNQAKTAYAQNGIGLLTSVVDDLGGNASSVVRDNYRISKKGRAVYNGLARRAGLATTEIPSSASDLTDFINSKIEALGDD